MNNVLPKISITQSELFSGWPEEAIEKLIAASDVVNHDAKTVLHRTGDVSEYLYLVVAGCVQLSRRVSDRDFTAWLYFAGDCHGIGPAVSNLPFTYTATCKEPTTLVRIPTVLLRDMVRADGSLSTSLFAALDRRYRNARRLHESASTFSTRDRIAALLVSFMARSVRCGDASEVNLSQEEMATMLGTRRQVVNRALREMEQANIVRIQYGRIAIVDRQRLSEMAEGAG